MRRKLRVKERFGGGGPWDGREMSAMWPPVAVFKTDGGTYRLGETKPAPHPAGQATGYYWWIPDVVPAHPPVS